MLLSSFQCSFYSWDTFPGENLCKIKFGASDMGIVNVRRKVDGQEEILMGSFVHVSGDLYLNDENYDNHNSSEVDNKIFYFKWQ